MVPSLMCPGSQAFLTVVEQDHVNRLAFEAERPVTPFIARFGECANGITRPGPEASRPQCRMNLDAVA